MTTVFLLTLVVAAAIAGLGVRSYFIRRGFEARFERDGRAVEIEGGALNLLELGSPTASGPPIVLIHGSGSNLKDLKVSLGERLARDRRVILVDRPGHGWSDLIDREGIHTPEVQAMALNAALASIGAERPLIVGHDWGGAMALSYALGYPEEVAGIVAIAPISHPSTRGVPAITRIAAMPYLGWLVSQLLVPVIGSILVDQSLRRQFWPQRVPGDHSEGVAVPLLLRPETFRSNARDIIELDAYLQDQSVYYGQISAPLVVIVGEDDAVAPPGGHAEKLAAAVADARLVVLNEVGHMPHHSSPNVIAFEVNRLAESLS